MRYDSLKLYRELFGIVQEEVFLAPYRLPHRFYHTLTHLDHNLDLMRMLAEEDVPEEYVIANLFHDICYDPRRTDNEERSVQRFLDAAKPHLLRSVIADLIMTTKISMAKNLLTDADLWDLRHVIDVRSIQIIERNIFKEFQNYNLHDFVTGRKKVLDAYASEYYRSVAQTVFKYRVCVYPGSFNPLHIGHQSVIEQAEQVFDKVIIAVGINPDKPNSLHTSADQAFPFHEVVAYNGLLTDFITDLEKQYGAYADFTVIRGLRNGADLSYETNQLEFMRRMKPDIKVMFIPCDKTREHVSSSAIRALERFSPSEADKYEVKKYHYIA